MRKVLLTWGLLLSLSLGMVSGGCASQEARDRDPMLLVKQAQELGVEAEAILMFGSGHAGGFAYNLTGSSGFIRIKVNPQKDAGP